MDQTQHLVVTATTILMVAALVQVVARRIPVPSILLYLLIGVAFGPGALNLIATDDMGATLPAIVRLAVAIIVFEGAFSLEGHYLRQVRRPVYSLVTLGLIVTAIGGTLVAHWVAGLPWSLALQYAALVSVTGPTVITPLLQRVRVTGRVRTTLAGEGVIIDPIGAVFALVVFQFISAPGTDLSEGVVWVVQRLVVGALWGAVAGAALLYVLRQLKDHPSQIARIMTIAGAAFIYTSVESFMHESGLAAIVVAGLLIGNRDFPHREEVHRFKGDITLIVIASVYLLLAATLDIDDLWELGWRGPLAVLLMMFLVRPIGVTLSTMRSSLSNSERAFVAAIGPRGVVAASLATLVSLELEALEVAGASSLLGLVFLTISISIAIQASYAGWLARRLKVMPMDILIIGAGRVGRMLAQEMLRAGEDVTVIERNPDRAELVREIGAHVIIGDGTKADVLEKADIVNAKTVVATTTSDQDNLLACQIAKTKFGKNRLVARVLDPDAVPSFEEAGITVMNPARATAVILSNLIRRPNIFRLMSEVENVDGADIREVVVRSERVDQLPLKELRLPDDVLVLLVRRGEKRLIPHGDTRLEKGDVVTMVGSQPSLERAVRALQAR